jgi:LysR family transcriptional regulator, low CO2-responsive transcriptional regulator
MLQSMDLWQLKMFCAVARQGSLVAAARELHLTPSAVSHGVKALETQLGCRLLDRVGKKVYLNQAGEQLLAQIESHLVAIDSAEQEIRRLAQWGQTRLRVGASASACHYILPKVIRELKKSFDRASIQIESGDTPELVEMIRQNRLDLVLGLEPQDPSGLEVRPLFNDELLFTFSSSHPWATAKTITRNEVARQHFILYQRQSFTARLVEEYFRSEHISPVAVMEIADIEAIKEMVKLNLGVAVLAPWTTEREIKKGTLRMRHVGARTLKRKWVLVSRYGRRLSLIEESFCKLCRQFVTAMPTDHRDMRRD